MATFLQQATQEYYENEGDDHHVCKKHVDIFSVKIECENCIDNVTDETGNNIFDCKCYHRSVLRELCLTCELLKQSIEKWQEEIDNILQEESKKIKTLCVCDENAFKKIPELVRKIRHSKRILLQKIHS